MEYFRPTPQTTVVSGPMGVGKSGVNRAAMSGLREADNITWGIERVFSISHTSRPRRVEAGESLDAYVFNVDPKRFEEGLKTGEFMETAHHSDAYYATPTPERGQPIHMEVEVTGVKQMVENELPSVREACEGLRAVYLLPSSMDDLWTQIMGRNDGMSPEKKLKRVARFPSEVLYIIENNLPYFFVSTVHGEYNVAENNTVRYMLGDDSVPSVGESYVEAQAEQAIAWLGSMGCLPEPIS